jgi:hypothetical protein
LRAHCVSRPEREDFSGFFHDYRCFQTHCVSRGVPGYFGQRVARERLTGHHVDANPLAQPTLAVVVAVALVPRFACAPMALSLAFVTAACALSSARPRVRCEPLAANPARPPASHHCLLKRRQRGSPGSGGHHAQGTAGWVISREQTRVISRER